MQSKKDKALKKAILNYYIHNDELIDKLLYISKLDEEKVYESLSSSSNGLDYDEVINSKKNSGENIIKTSKNTSLFYKVVDSFITPFSISVFLLFIISIFIDIFHTPLNEINIFISNFLFCIILTSGFFRLYKTNKKIKLDKTINEKRYVSILRHEGKKRLPIEEVVVGDIIFLSSGDIVPADIRILSSNNLYVDQSFLTGESDVKEKNSTFNNEDKLTNINNLVFKGSKIINGNLKGIVIHIGNDTLLASSLNKINVKNNKASVDNCVNFIISLLIKFILAIVPIFLLINDFIDGGIIKILLFAISIIVMIIPEIILLIIEFRFNKKINNIFKDQIIIKNIDKISKLGNTDIFCFSKTNTLTNFDVVNKSILEAFNYLKQNNIDIKILTSDSVEATLSFINQIDFATSETIIGKDLYDMDDEKLYDRLMHSHVFCCLTSDNKERIIKVLKEKGHTVSYMGNGVNDISSLKEADVSITFNNTLTLVKENGDIILLKDNLKILNELINVSKNEYLNVIRIIK